MRNFWAILFMVALTVVHGCIVVLAMLSLPLVLIYPWTRMYYMIGIGILLMTWVLFTDCPLTTVDRRIRSYLQWPQLKEDFTSHYLTALTGLRVYKQTHRIAERVYLALVIVIILFR